MSVPASQLRLLRCRVVGMSVPLRETDLYAALKENLNRNARGTLLWVERRIEEDPSLGPGRRELDNGDILDFSAEDLRVVYRLISPEMTLLRLVWDERDL